MHILSFVVFITQAVDLLLQQWSGEVALNGCVALLVEHSCHLCPIATCTCASNLESAFDNRFQRRTSEVDPSIVMSNSSNIGL